jgi:deoxyribodipyrimidine photo-lyase
MNGEGIQLVWFKRDLRATDHPPLHYASLAGKVLPVYVWEPDFWQQADAHAQHAAFIAECLDDLAQQLRRLGCELQQTQSDMVTLLDQLHASLGIAALYSHEETGNLWTYARDNRVKAWCLAHQVPWHEWRQDGVVRRLTDRNGWADHWEAFFALPPQTSAEHIQGVSLPVELNTSASELRLRGQDKPLRQKGGTQRASKLLDSFLDRRGLPYRYALSSPNTAPKHCSRLSPQLAYGTLSMRQIVHRLSDSQQRWKAETPAHPDRDAWLKSLRSFESRLHWHCHFMQKLETQPNMQTHNLHPALDTLARPLNSAIFNAFCQGETGYPFVDACIKRLHATGWINFRMRAMLVSFACNLLWLPWQAVAAFLAREFTDYEPGIHYPQVQMQAGTTGMNVLRVYNPVKQSQDQDPHGEFIRNWLPQLTHVPNDYLHTPWQLTPNLQQRYGVIMGIDYPMPIVEHSQAAREAKIRIYGLRKNDENRAITKQLLNKHGSRQTNPRKTHSRRIPPNDNQLSLSF